MADLRALVPIDPSHLPQAIEAVGRDYPAVPQVVCFGTAFHSQMPRVVLLYAHPGRLAEREHFEDPPELNNWTWTP